MQPRFEWDDNKADATWRERGIRFEEAVSVFDDPRILIEPDRRRDCGEDRFRAIGAVGKQHFILFIAFTFRDDMEIIRIISVRRANPRERRRYGNRDL